MIIQTGTNQYFSRRLKEMVGPTGKLKKVLKKSTFLCFTHLTFDNTGSPMHVEAKVIGLSPLPCESINVAYLGEDKVFVPVDSKLNSIIHRKLKETGITQKKIDNCLTERNGAPCYRYKVTLFSAGYRFLRHDGNKQEESNTMKMDNISESGRFFYVGHFEDCSFEQAFEQMGTTYTPSMTRGLSRIDSLDECGSTLDWAKRLTTHFRLPYLAENLFTSSEMKAIPRTLKKDVLTGNKVSNEANIKEALEELAIVCTGSLSSITNVWPYNSNTSEDERQLRKELRELTSKHSLVYLLNYLEKAEITRESKEIYKVLLNKLFEDVIPIRDISYNESLTNALIEKAEEVYGNK